MFIVTHFISAANIIGTYSNLDTIWKCAISAVYTGGYVTKLAVKELHVAVFEITTQNHKITGFTSFSDFVEKCGPITTVGIGEGLLQFSFMKFIMHANPNMVLMIVYTTIPTTLTCFNMYSDQTEPKLSFLKPLPNVASAVVATTKLVTSIVQYVCTIDHN